MFFLLVFTLVISVCFLSSRYNIGDVFFKLVEIYECGMKPVISPIVNQYNKKRNMIIYKNNHHVPNTADIIGKNAVDDIIEIYWKGRWRTIYNGRYILYTMHTEYNCIY